MKANKHIFYFPIINTHRKHIHFHTPTNTPAFSISSLSLALIDCFIYWLMYSVHLDAKRIFKVLNYVIGMFHLDNTAENIRARAWQCYPIAGAYPGGRPPGGGGSESLILAHWSKVEKCRPNPPGQFCALRVSSWSPRPAWGAQIRDSQNFGTCGDRGWLRGDVPPQKWRKNEIFEVNSHDLVLLFLPEVPTQTQAP